MPVVPPGRGRGFWVARPGSGRAVLLLGVAQQAARLHAPAVITKWVSDDAQLERAYGIARHLTDGEVMSTPVVKIAPDATAWEATETMLERRIGHLPVVGPDGVLVGVLSRLDLLRCLIAGPDHTD